LKNNILSSVPKDNVLFLEVDYSDINSSLKITQKFIDDFIVKINNNISSTNQDKLKSLEVSDTLKTLNINDKENDKVNDKVDENEFIHSENESNKLNKLLNWQKYNCEKCGNKEFNGENAYNNHLKSRQHKKRKIKTVINV